MVTLNAQELLHRSLASASVIADEIIVVDAGSTDSTLHILKLLKIIPIKVRTNHLGRNKAKALSLATGDLVLSLDSDEILSRGLIKEILKIKNSKTVCSGYIIPFRNYFLSKRIKHGGENYAMIRLARRKYVSIKQVSVHESLVLRSKNVGKLSSPIIHHSYRNLVQVYKKFTTYALNEARERFENGEKSSLKKIVLYPVHMFWARFIKDKGYKDGILRIPLDLGFAYMELVTYCALAYKNIVL